MDRLLPCGSLAIVDPDSDITNGSVFLLEWTQELGAGAIRRLQSGSTKVMLVAESHSYYEDVVLDTGEVHILGRVVWNQPLREFD